MRASGNTYTEINNALKSSIPKSTLSNWCKNIQLPENYHEKVRKLNKLSFEKAREISTANRQRNREVFFHNLDVNNVMLFEIFKNNVNVRKIVLAILYLAEGSKTARGSLMFGNSDPSVVKIFFALLRECYKIDEFKFRCTVQCRSGQNTLDLEKFWSGVTEVPLKQFYKARIDKRTIGKVLKKPDYKGVCRIDYFSSAVDLELKRIAQRLLSVN